MRRPALALALLSGLMYCGMASTRGGDTNKTPARPRLVVQTGLAGINAVAAAPDGSQLLTSDMTTVVRLWEAATGKEIARLQGHTALPVSALAFSADGKKAITGGADNTARLWDLASGREIRALVGHTDAVIAVALSPDGKRALTGSRDKTARLWDPGTGREIWRYNGHTAAVRVVAFAPDNRFVYSGSDDKTVRRWDVTTARNLGTFNHPHEITALALSPDSQRMLVAARMQTAWVWEIFSAKELCRLDEKAPIRAGAFSGDGSRVHTAAGRVLRTWDAQTGKEIDAFPLAANAFLASFNAGGSRLALAGNLSAGNVYGAEILDLRTRTCTPRAEGRTDHIRSIAVSPDGKYLVVGKDDRMASLWDLSLGKEVRRFEHRAPVTATAFSADSKKVLVNSAVWDVASGRPVCEFPGSAVPVAFTPDGTRIVTGGLFSADGKQLLTHALEKGRAARLWDLTTGKEMRRLEPVLPDGTHPSYVIELWDPAAGRRTHHYPWGQGKINEPGSSLVTAMAFAPGGKRVLTGHRNRKATLWDIATGKQLLRFDGHADEITSVRFAPDGKHVLTASKDGTARLWDASSANEVRLFEGHAAWVKSADFTSNGKHVITAGSDHTVRFWDIRTGHESCRLVSFRNGGWAVIDRNGLYDASNGGDVDGLHWVDGLELIALRQLKERYYDPGLLAKHLGANKEALRNVAAFQSVKLFPTVVFGESAADATQLEVQVINRGGGIGKVQVFVNGKELLADARGPGADPKAAKAILTVDLANAPSLIPGQDNVVEVVTWNTEGYLSSRGLTRVYRPKGKKDDHPPELHAIVVGVSDYATPALSLRYAAKDAADVAKALELGARRLFGADKVHLTLLTTSKHPKAKPPTRANIEKAFADARKARPGDVLIVYLAGHGVALQSGTDVYCYLTQEARTTDAAVLSDPAILGQYAVTSNELIEWIKKIPALKQVMVLDTCAAGAAAAKLTEQRQVTADQIRAIERLKDRTGFHILMGCAADKVSYEATQYQQGLLTHALLKGMRGAALREEEYVDVSKLFQYAADQVPELAKNIGGIQKPMIASPRGTSFDVGRLITDDKALIPLALLKPLLLRPLLINADEGDDNLRLMPLLRKRLNDESFMVDRKGGPAVFVDAEEMPGAIRPSGTYTVEGDKVKVRLLLRQDGKTLKTLQVEGDRNNLERLVTAMVEAIDNGLSRGETKD